jgi:uncharacterized protein YuzE
MLNPIQFRMDYEVEAGYLRYRPLPAGQHVARTQRISDDVNADFDAAGQVLGLELLAFDEVAFNAARVFAEAHDLVFPYERLKRAVQGGGSLTA